MLKSLWRMMVLAALISLLPAQTVYGQDEDNPRDFVLEALERLAGTSHQFTSEATISTAMQGAEQQYEIYNVIEEQGEVADNGDYHVLITRTSGASLEEAEAIAPFEVEQVQLEGETYINLLLEDTPYAEELAVEAGWWRYDDLLAQFDGIMRVAIESQLNYRLPLILFLDPEIITDVTELEPEVIDGVEMRVFQLELDALTVLLRQSAGMDSVQLEDILNQVSLMAASDVSLDYRLWIGAEDGLIYKGVSEGRTYIPYLSEEIEDGPDYDMDTRASIEFTISAHDEPVEINAPSERELNN